jgi:hypothetical protein
MAPVLRASSLVVAVNGGGSPWRSPWRRPPAGGVLRLDREGVRRAVGQLRHHAGAGAGRGAGPAAGRRRHPVPRDRRATVAGGRLPGHLDRLVPGGHGDGRGLARHRPGRDRRALQRGRAPPGGVAGPDSTSVRRHGSRGDLVPPPEPFGCQRRGITAGLGLDHGPHPAAFLARTLSVYAVPLLSRVTVQLRAQTVVHARPPGDATTL